MENEKGGEARGQVKGSYLWSGGNWWSAKRGGRQKKAGWATKAQKFKEHVKARIKGGPKREAGREIETRKKWRLKGGGRPERSRGQKKVEAEKGWEAKTGWEAGGK